MISSAIRRGFFTLRVYHYSGRPSRAAALQFAAYFQTKSADRALGFVRQRAATKVIDLSASEEELLRSCSKTNIYKIKRARREGICFVVERDMAQFVQAFNEFAETKRLPAITRREVDQYGESIVVTKAVAGGDTVVMHSHLLDRAEGRARLVHSASFYRDIEDTAQRNLYGRANRLLHFEEMLHFKRQGYRCYDFGGYAPGTTDPELLGINEFKDGFGGELVIETNYFSLPYYLYRSWKSAVVRHRQARRIRRRRADILDPDRKQDTRGQLEDSRPTETS